MCFIGERLPQPHKIERDCPCGVEDFEWFVSGAFPLLIFVSPLAFAVNSTTSVTSEACVFSLKVRHLSNPTKPAPGTNLSGTTERASAKFLTRRAKAASLSIAARRTPVLDRRTTAGSSGQRSPSLPSLSLDSRLCGGLGEGVGRDVSGFQNREKGGAVGFWM